MKMKKIIPLLFAWIVLSWGGELSAATLQVPQQYPTIQAAINAAVNGDTVLVAPGTYSGVGNFNISFRGKAITVKSEKGPYGTIIDAGESQLISAVRCFIFSQNETSSSVLGGFTIRNGNATGQPGDDTGGGIKINFASPLIKNCIIKNNSAAYGGGAAVIGGRWPKFENTIFEDNHATTQGGGFFGDNMSEYYTISFENCVFRNNSAGPAEFSGKEEMIYWGGAISLRRAGADLTNVTIAHNTAQNAGAIFKENVGPDDPSPLFIQNSIIAFNAQPQFYLTHTVWTTVTYSDILGGLPEGTSVGEGVIDEDPKFFSSTNLKLDSFSPCIDSADGRIAAMYDLEYLNRYDDRRMPNVHGGTSPYPDYIDMGAYERQIDSRLIDTGAI